MTNPGHTFSIPVSTSFSPWSRIPSASVDAMRAPWWMPARRITMAEFSLEPPTAHRITAVKLSLNRTPHSAVYMGTTDPLPAPQGQPKA